MPETLKTTRPSHHLPPIEPKILKNIELCVVAYLKQDIKMTAPFRNTGTNQLLLSFAHPHKPILTATLSSWWVTIMKEPGIKINIFGSYSTRSVSTSKCKMRMKKHLHNFMIGQFKRIFQIVYLDEIYCFLFVYVYIWCYICRKHICDVNCAGNGVNQIEKKSWIFHNFFHSFSPVTIYTRVLETN